MNPWPAVRNGALRSLRQVLALGLPLLVLAVSVSSSPGYSLLTNEEIIDILWTDEFQPLLLERFPDSSVEQLRKAHAYAYGGSLIQDLGYYPFGSHLFSDLAHYVRTGDFVTALIQEAQNLNEYAFALGALAHYCSDNDGHPLINRAVGLNFPHLRAKYGASVTYEESPQAHLRTEFGFDITQVAKRRYTSDRYHDFIGFEVSRPVLERAFLKTYGLRADEVLGEMDLAIGTFRYSVSQVIPEMTRAALRAYHPELVDEVPNFNERQFLYNVSRAQYQTEWGREYKRPGLVARVLGWLVRFVPKVGALHALAFKIPTPETEDLYLRSVNLTVADLRKLLAKVKRGDLTFPNMDCDTGKPTSPNQYKLCDRTYAEWLDELAKKRFKELSPAARENILGFYARADSLKELKRKYRHRIPIELASLRAGPESELAQKMHRRLFAEVIKLRSPKDEDNRPTEELYARALFHEAVRSNRNQGGTER